MADSVGAGAARGLQAGWQMGMQADQAERQRANDERQQAQQDRQFGLQQDAATRAQATADAALARQNAQLDRQNSQDDYKLLTAEHDDIVKQSAAFQSQGQAVPPELATRYGQVAGALRQHREKVLAPRLAAEQTEDAKYWSDVQAGKIDPNTTPAGELYARLSRYTGMVPADIAKAAEGAQLVQQGFDSGNQQMLMQGVNQIAAKDLKAGIGAASPHGGVITRKEIVGLVPVKDANGVEHPDKVFPVVRTYVMHPNGAGAEDYYDAPLTQNRSSDPNDPPKALDLNHAFDYMGRVGAMATLLQDPTLSAKLEQGAKEVGEKTKGEVDAITSLGRYHLQEAAKGAVAQKLQAIYSTLPPGEERDRAVGVALGTVAPAKAPTGLAATMAAVDSRKDLTEAEKAEQKTLATPGQSAKAVAKIRAASALENTRLRAALKATAAKATADGVSVPKGKDGEPLMGEAFLKTIDPGDAIMVRRIVQGTADPKNIQARGGERTKFMRWASLYDPEFNEADFNTGKNTERAFTTGVEGRKVRSFNVALEHLDSLKKAAEALKNGDMKKYNEIANWWGDQTGKPAPATFGALAQIVGAEVTGAVVAGGGGVTERREMEKHFSTSASPEQYLGVHNGLKDLMGGQLKGLYQQYTAGQGKRNFNDFLTSGGKGAASDLGVNFKAPPRWGTPEASRPSARGMGEPVAPMGGSGAPARVQTATNPKTGEKLMLQNGQWVPFK